jgi:hypothetical protein
MQKNWYESFFRGVALDMWRKAVTPEQTRADVDFLEKALQLPRVGGFSITPAAMAGIRWNWPRAVTV